MLLVLTIIAFLAILIIGHELGHFITAKRFGVKVEEFGVGFPPKLLARQFRGTKYSLNFLPFGGFVRIRGEHRTGKGIIDEDSESFINQPISRRALIIVSGVIANFIIGWLAISLVFAIGVPSKILITEVLPNSPAAAAGFRAGEEIKGFTSVEEFLNFIKVNQGQAISVNDKTVTPRVDPAPEEGAIGVKIEGVSIPQEDPLTSLTKGFTTSLKITGAIIKAAGQLLGGLVTGNFVILEQVTGPVGIFGIIKQTEGIVFLTYLLGLISLNLAVINLIPFPALDGGRLLFLAVEKIIGRPLNYQIELVTNAIGFALLILLIVVVTFRDIMRVF